MVGESNQNVFLIEIDASSFAEFEISEFEITRFDCIQETAIDIYAIYGIKCPYAQEELKLQRELFYL